MKIYKVYEKSIWQNTNVSYWLDEEKAKTEKKRLVDEEMKTLESSLEDIQEYLEKLFCIEPIEVRE